MALAAGHKSVALEWVDVDPHDRSPVEAVSGQRLVPVLVDGDEVVFDSPAVLEWLERRYPDPPLYPRGATRRAEAQVFVEWFNGLWKRPPNLIAAELGASMRAALDVFEGLLDGRDYLLGEFGVADAIAFPFLKYPVFGLPPDDDEVFHRVLVEQMPLGDGYPRLRAWTERVDEHPRS